MKKNYSKITPVKEVSQKLINRRNFISAAGFLGFGALAFGSWRWLFRSAVEEAGITGNARKPLRRALNQNELLFRKTFSNDHLVKTYPKEMADPNVRINSLIGLEDKTFKAEDWALILNKKDGSQLKLTLKELQQLPKTEIVYDFKCVEGWDQISYWGGVKFTDFIEYFRLQEEAALAYVGMATPDEEYYVGIDMPSALHPQTLLAYEMNGRPLIPMHGQPLRLIIPVKYGIKNLKRIGTISFSNERPPDYWAEQGYDYYSGL